MKGKIEIRLKGLSIPADHGLITSTELARLAAMTPMDIIPKLNRAYPCAKIWIDSGPDATGPIFAAGYATVSVKVLTNKPHDLDQILATIRRETNSEASYFPDELNSSTQAQADSLERKAPIMDVDLGVAENHAAEPSVHPRVTLNYTTQPAETDQPTTPKSTQHPRQKHAESEPNTPPNTPQRLTIETKSPTIDSELYSDNLNNGLQIQHPMSAPPLSGTENAKNNSSLVLTAETSPRVISELVDQCYDAVLIQPSSRSQAPIIATSNALSEINSLTPDDDVSILAASSSASRRPVEIIRRLKTI